MNAPIDGREPGTAHADDRAQPEVAPTGVPPRATATATATGAHRDAAATGAPLLTRTGIAALIPHSGSMCLLARLDEWDRDRIVCHATSHRDPANPLRSASGLLATAAIEYAAQAMALHGALIGQAAGSAATPGYLASARGVRLQRLRLDDLGGDLRVEARRSAGDARQILYAFDISHDGTTVATGRATVVLNTTLASA